MPNRQPHEPPPGSPCADRRGAQRYPSGHDGSCHPASHLDTTPVTVSDVSTGGIGLISARPFDLGTVLVLELGEAAPGPVVLLARVVRIAARPDGSWRAGCVFPGEVGEEELAALRAERKRPAAPAGRAAVRLPGHRVALCRPVGVGNFGQWAGEVRDVSPSGVALLLPIPVEPGAQFHLELAEGGGEPARTELVRVVDREHQPDGRCLLSCEVVPAHLSRAPPAARSRMAI